MRKKKELNILKKRGRKHRYKSCLCGYNILRERRGVGEQQKAKD